eukprot:COSAG02_NODE_4014_length_5905_cov_3.990872_7_plen_46_part_00
MVSWVASAGAWAQDQAYRCKIYKFRVRGCVVVCTDRMHIRARMRA